MNRICLMAFAWLAVVPLLAQKMPFAFPFQGRLVLPAYGAEGVQVEGAHTLHVALYERPTGGAALWARTYPDVKVDALGNFSVTLEDAPGTPPAQSLRTVIVSGKTLFVELAVDGGSGLDPRVRLRDVPRVMRATSANASDGEGDFIAQDGVTAEALVPTDTSSVRRLTIRAQQLTVDGKVTVARPLTLTGPLGAANVSGFGAVPVGTIVAYAGDPKDLPPEWVVCDGSRADTPNLAHRFIRGVSSSEASNSLGGAETVTLEPGNLPSHKHTVSETLASEINGNPKDAPTLGSDSNYWCRSKSEKESLTGMTGGNENGSTAAHNNLPPYCNLRFIMRVH